MMLTTINVTLRFVEPEDRFEAPYYYDVNVDEPEVEGHLLVTELKALSWLEGRVRADGWKIKRDGTPSRAHLASRSVRITDLPDHVQKHLAGLKIWADEWNSSSFPPPPLRRWWWSITTYTGDHPSATPTGFGYRTADQPTRSPGW